MMQIYITQEELFTDLSNCLTAIKTKLTKIIINNSKKGESFNSHTYQHIIEHAIQKYNRNPKIENSLLNVVHRFFSRVRQFLTHFMVKISKQNKAFLSPIKKIELSCKSEVTVHNFAYKFSNLLQKIKTLEKYQQQSLTIDVLSMSSHISPKCEKKHKHFLSSMKLGSTSQPSQSLYKQSQVDMLAERLEKYNSMQIDCEHYRGRYFDLKENQQTVEEDMFYRNRYIRQIMSNYQKEYIRFKVKIDKQKSLSMKRQDKNERMSKTAWSSRYKKQNKTIDYQEKKNVLSNQKKLHSSRYNTLQIQQGSYAKVEVENFRKMFENKLREKKNPTKIHNIVMMGHNFDQQKVKKDKINFKRLQFFKKSQNQVTRYKQVFKESNPLKQSMKFKAINPETTFTLLYTTPKI